MLAIMTSLFALIVPTFSSRQDRVQFTQGVRDLDSKINDVMNDVSTGYFPDADFDCNVNAIGVTPVPGSGKQGQRKNCVYMGKIIGVNNDGAGSGNSLKIFTIVGRALSDNSPVKNLADADPVAVAPITGTNTPDITEQYTTKWGLEITKIIRPGSAPAQEPGAFGFFTRLNSNGSQSSSTKTVDHVFVRNTDVDDSNDEFINKIAAENSQATPWSFINPEEGLLLCIGSVSSDDTAAIMVGGTSGSKPAGPGKTIVTFGAGEIEAAYGSGVCS